MASQCGPEHLGDLAREQLEAMRRDPRLDRSEAAVVANFYNSLWEIHSNLMIAKRGARRLTDEVATIRRERVRDESERLGRDAELQAAWEAAKMAEAAIETDFPWLHTMGVAQHVFALDALVERLAPDVQEMLLITELRALLDRVRRDNPEEAAHVAEVHGADVWEAVFDAALTVVVDDAPTPGRPRGTGVDRYEPLLAAVGIGLPELPEDLAHALAEAHTIRNVVVHRAGFVDERAIERCPGFPFPAGNLLRLVSTHYRRYSAAIRTFAELILPIEPRNSLEDWRDNYLIGV